MVFHHRDQRAPDGETRAVQRVHELRLALRVAEARLHPPRLERLAVRARRDLAVGVLRGQPHFEVVGLGGGEADVAGAQRDDAVRQLEAPQDRFGVAGHLFERLVRSVRMDDLHHFDLVELMLADHAARVLAVASGLGAEARRVRGEPDRQRLRRQDLAAHGIRERDLGGRYEVEPLGSRRIVRVDPASFHREHVGFEFRQLRRADQRLGIDDVGRVALGVAVLGRLRVEHELRERAVQSGEPAAQEHEPRAGELRRRREIEQPEALADVGVIAHGEVERPRRAPAAHLDVVVGRLSRPARSHA